MLDAIVVGVDGTADSLAALSAAAGLGEESNAGLVVVFVRHENWLAATGGTEFGAAGLAINAALDETENRTRERAADVLRSRRVPWRFDVVVGDPASELIAIARREHATAIVVGGRGHGVVGGLVGGSVAQKLVRHSPITVLVVRNGHVDHLDVASSANPN